MVNVLLARGHRLMPHQLPNLRSLGSGLAQPCPERVPERVQHQVRNLDAIADAPQLILQRVLACFRKYQIASALGAGSFQYLTYPRCHRNVTMAPVTLEFYVLIAAHLDVTVQVPRIALEDAAAFRQVKEFPETETEIDADDRIRPQRLRTGVQPFQLALARQYFVT